MAPRSSLKATGDGLRSVLIAIGGLAFIAGFGALYYGALSPALVFAFWGVLLIAGTVYERGSYKGTETSPPGREFERTRERFIDDQTGQPITVYINRATGERRYVADQRARR